MKPPKKRAKRPRKKSTVIPATKDKKLNYVLKLNKPMELRKPTEVRNIYQEPKNYYETDKD